MGDLEQWRRQEFSMFFFGGSVRAKPVGARGKGAGGGAPSAGRFSQFFNKNNAFL